MGAAVNRTGYPDFKHYWSLYTCDHEPGVGPSILDFNTKNGPQLTKVDAAGLSAIMAHEPRQYPSFPRKPLGWPLGPFYIVFARYSFLKEYG